MDIEFPPKEAPTGKRAFRTVTFGDLANLLESFNGTDAASRQLELVELSESFATLAEADRRLVIDIVSKLKLLADTQLELSRVRLLLPRIK